MDPLENNESKETQLPQIPDMSEGPTPEMAAAMTPENLQMVTDMLTEALGNFFDKCAAEHKTVRGALGLLIKFADVKSTLGGTKNKVVYTLTKKEGDAEKPVLRYKLQQVLGWPKLMVYTMNMQLNENLKASFDTMAINNNKTRDDFAAYIDNKLNVSLLMDGKVQNTTGIAEFFADPDFTKNVMAEAENAQKQT